MSGDSGTYGPRPTQPPNDLARQALAAARSEARRRGQAARRRAEAGRRIPAAQRDDVASGARPDERDPQPLGRTIDRLVTERGWETPAAVGGIMGRWGDLVGAEVAAHCQPRSFDDGVLTVAADSTAWATQVRLLAADLLRRLNVELGHGTVTKIDIRGPGNRAWSAGPRSVHGERGPRDTYG